MGQRKTGKNKAGQQQQQSPQAPGSALQSPTSGVDPTAAAAAAAAGVQAQQQQQAQPEVSLSTLHSLEEKKRKLGHQLKDVERQIYDLETRYLEACNPNANALTGYEGLLSGVGGSNKPANKPSAVVQEDRIFSGSSTTTVAR